MRNNIDSVPNALSALYNDWINFKNDGVKTQEITKNLLPILEQNLSAPGVKEILELNLANFI